MFLALGVVFPVAVTLLAYEANRRMGPTIAGAIAMLVAIVVPVVLTLLVYKRQQAAGKLAQASA